MKIIVALSDFWRIISLKLFCCYKILIRYISEPNVAYPQVKKGMDVCNIVSLFLFQWPYV